MNALLALLVLATYLGVAFFLTDGPTAVLACAAAAVAAGLVINRHGGEEREFLLRIFVVALLLRMAAGTGIYMLRLQDFFGGDAITYHTNAMLLIEWWQDGIDWGAYRYILEPALGQNGGMLYYVGGLYWLTGPNMLALQYVNSVVGAATAPVIYLCALHIFRHTRVARLSAYLVAFYPSLLLWSSQGLKDGPIVFLLALVMLATLKLGERWNVAWLAVMVAGLFGLLGLRFYIFYMATAAVLGAFLIGVTRHSAQTLARQVILILCVGLALTYLGVLRTATRQLDTFADLDRIQLSRADLAGSAQSGFGRDIDVSTSSGALSAIPVGMVYLLFAPFPWQVVNLRQSITLPEMLVWWGSFPLLVLGAYFTVRYRLRQALPILIFTSMLTLAYSIFQGNVGTAYRQRSQILVFYFIFVAVGYVLMKERREDSKRKQVISHQAVIASARASQERRRALDRARREREKEWADVARGLSDKIDF
jgi:hypothetical protein